MFKSEAEFRTKPILSLFLSVIEPKNPELSGHSGTIVENVEWFVHWSQGWRFPSAEVSLNTTPNLEFLPMVSMGACCHPCVRQTEALTYCTCYSLHLLSNSGCPPFAHTLTQTSSCFKIGFLFFVKRSTHWKQHGKGNSLMYRTPFLLLEVSLSNQKTEAEWIYRICWTKPIADES